MADQFREGEIAVRRELEGDHIRLYSTTIATVGASSVTDANGVEHRIDRTGESSTIEPMNDYLAHELRVKGEGFVIAEDEIERDPWEQEPPEIGGGGIAR